MQKITGFSAMGSLIFLGGTDSNTSVQQRLPHFFSGAWVTLWWLLGRNTVSGYFLSNPIGITHSLAPKSPAAHCSHAFATVKARPHRQNAVVIIARNQLFPAFERREYWYNRYPGFEAPSLRHT
jgi:hypothetical protein